MLRRGQIVRLIEPGGSAITTAGVFPVGTLYRVAVDEDHLSRLVTISLLNPENFPRLLNPGRYERALSRRFELVEEGQDSDPDDHYVIYNTVTRQTVSSDNIPPIGYYTYDDAIARCNRYFRAVNGGDRSTVELHIIPLRSVTKVTIAGVTDYRET